MIKPFLFYNHLISFIGNVNSSQAATPTNAVATPTDTTINLQPAGSTGGTGSMEINTIMQLGMVGVSGLFLMHLL